MVLKHGVEGPDFERRLDKMVEAGRVSAEEAARLRAADPAQRAELIRETQLKHARGRLDEEVRAGRATSAEAEDILDRLAKGEGPRVLARLRRRQR